MCDTAIEKEINVFLPEHLHSLERIREVAEAEGAARTLTGIDREISYINSKLYQKPPLTED